MIKIYCCDAMYFLKGLGEESVDMVLTDPMNTKDSIFNALWLKECYRILKKGKVLCSFCTPSTLDDFISQLKNAGFNHLKTIYRFNNFTGNREPCIIMGKHRRKIPKIENYYKAYNDTIGGFPSEAQKPIEMLKEMIMECTKEGDIVIDHFLGSGSTAEACKKTKRSFQGCEVDFKWCNLAKKRLGFRDAFQTGI